jgi:hypothetical protein
MLFLHHQVQFFQTVKGSAVFCQVMLRRLEKPYQGNAAFVSDGFAHCFIDAGAKVSVFQEYETVTAPEKGADMIIFPTLILI